MVSDHGGKVEKPIFTDEEALKFKENTKEKPQKGKVIAAGPGKASDTGSIVKMEVKVDDVILYGKYSGTEVTVDGKEYLIMRESDILAVI